MTATAGQELLTEVITGVAISKAANSEIFFGCATEPAAPAGSLGGGGVLDVSKGQVTALKSNSSLVYAGSMLVTDVCVPGGEARSASATSKAYALLSSASVVALACHLVLLFLTPL